MLGMMFDACLEFAEPGDQYLGRILVGLPPNSSKFAAIPPHIKCGMEDPDVNEAMQLCYGSIINHHNQGDPLSLRGNMTGILR